MPSRYDISERYVQKGGTPHVRMGALSIFVLVVIICLAIFAVLSYSTANASLTMAKRQVESFDMQYAQERSAQTFVSEVDGILSRYRTMSASPSNTQTAGSAVSASDTSASGEVAMEAAEEADEAAASDSSAAQKAAFDALIVALKGELGHICAHARDASGTYVQVSAHVVDDSVEATFTAASGRTLTITLRIASDATYTIESWKTSTVTNDEPSHGRLYIAG